MRPEDFRREQARIAARAERATQRTVDARQRAGWIDTAAMIARVIASANVAATLAADAWVETMIWRRPDFSKWVNTRPPGEVPRIKSAVEHVLKDPDPLPRLQRIARTEPEQAGREGVHRAMTVRQVERYRWELDPDPCDRCRALGAKTWPVSVVPESHPNCQCVPVPILEGSQP